MKSVDVYKDNEKITTCGLADSYFLRLRGLIGRRIEEVDGMLIKPCFQIHTFFMSYPIDVIYLDRENQIVRIDEKMEKSKCGKVVKTSSSVLELKSGEASRLGLKAGDRLTVSENSSG